MSLYSLDKSLQEILLLTITLSLSCTSPQLAHCFHTPFLATFVLPHFLQALMMLPLYFFLRHDLTESSHSDLQKFWLLHRGNSLEGLRRHCSSRRQFNIKKGVLHLYNAVRKTYLNLIQQLSF